MLNPDVATCPGAHVHKNKHVLWSVQDALAALDLAKLKAKHGRTFGISTVTTEGAPARLLSAVAKDLRCVLIGNKKALQR